MKTVNDVLSKGIRTSDEKHRKIEIVVKDSQSSATRAADMARELIFNDKVRWPRPCGCPGGSGAPCPRAACGCSASGTGWM